jgi:hypothetical protein
MGAQETVAVLPSVPAMAAGEFVTNGNAMAPGTCVCATLITSGVELGELTMYGRSAALPAAATTTTPRLLALALAWLRSSSFMP